MDASFDWGAVLAALPFLWEGMQLSLLLLAAGMVGGTALGLFVALVLLFGPRIPATIATAYVDGLRAIPLVLVLFWFYFCPPCDRQASRGAALRPDRLRDLRGGLLFRNHPRRDRQRQERPVAGPLKRSA